MAYSCQRCIIDRDYKLYKQTVYKDILSYTVSTVQNNAFNFYYTTYDECWGTSNQHGKVSSLLIQNIVAHKLCSF